MRRPEYTLLEKVKSTTLFENNEKKYMEQAIRIIKRLFMCTIHGHVVETTICTSMTQFNPQVDLLSSFTVLVVETCGSACLNQSGDSQSLLSWREDAYNFISFHSYAL